MQPGSLLIVGRKEGPTVWQFPSTLQKLQKGSVVKLDGTL
jgi:hypothetical protein